MLRLLPENVCVIVPFPVHSTTLYPIFAKNEVKCATNLELDFYVFCFALMWSSWLTGCWVSTQYLSTPLTSVFGIQSSALSFFGSNLTERKQMVSISGYSSNPSTLLHGLLRAQFSVPFCFYSTHNHSHRLLVVTQFPTVNLPMIASYMIQFHVNNLTLCLVTCSHV